MSGSTESNAHETSNSNAGSPTLPGRPLRVAREERKLSREDVAQRIKYSARQIEALEHDDYASLPPLISTRGMIRSYAKLVGIDAEPLVAQLNAHYSGGPPTVMVVDMAVPFPRRQAASPKLYWVLSALILVAMAAFLVEWFLSSRIRGPVSADTASTSANAATGTHRGEQSVPLAVPGVGEVPAPIDTGTPLGGTRAMSNQANLGVPAASATSTSVDTAGAKRVVLEFARDSWVEVRDSAGAVVLNQLHRAGSVATVEHKPPMRLIIGAASSVKMTYDGKPYDLSTATQVDVARFTLN